MAAPIVASTSPTIGQVDFDGIRNNLTATFSTALLSSSVNRMTVILYETESGRTVDLETSLSTDLKTITIVPNRPLAEAMSYRLSLIGADIAAPGGYIKSSGGDALATTYNVLFRTADERFVSREEILSREEFERVGPIRSVEDEAAVTGYLEIQSVTPAAFATNQSRSLSAIEVDFGEAVDTTGSGAAITIEMNPADGMTRDYGHEDVTGKFLYRDAEDVPSRLALIDEPTGVVSASGNKIIWTAEDDYEWPYNAEVTICVHSDYIVNASGHQLEEDTYFTFTTEYWPKYATPTVLRIELGPTISQLYDDTLYRIILKNSIRTLLESNDKCYITNRDRPYPNTEKFVKSQSIIDVINQLRLLADIQSGQRKQLGDFTVQFNASDPLLISKLKEATKDRDRSLRELRRYRGGGPLSAVVAETHGQERQDYRMRTWDASVAGSRPANCAEERAAKANLRTDHKQLKASTRRYLTETDQEIIIHTDDATSVFRI